jgi:hypothetical protein
MKLPLTAADFELKRLPWYSPCYCGECKQPLTEARIMDNRSAWCPSCRDFVSVAAFQVEGWVVGVTVFLLANAQLGLLA